MKRLKVCGRAASYHLIARTVAGEKLLERADQEVLRKQIHRMADFCGIEVLTYCILSNHFHLLVNAPPKRELSDAELVRRYRVLYGPEKAGELEVNLQSSQREELREGLLKRMHDISFFMKELKMRFTIYYNKTHDRFGTLWAERFKSLLIESRGRRNAVLMVAAYIDLNPVRAGLCDDPKDYRFCGYAEALSGSEAARSGLSRVIGQKNWREVARAYRTVLFGSGVVGDTSRVGTFDREKCRQVMKAKGKLSSRDLLRCRIRYFSDGVALGSAGFIARIREEFSDSSDGFPKTTRMPKIENTDLFFARPPRKTL